MPPRHNYWTIIFGNQPTSFRAATREELLPTFRQIQSKHPDAVMMWFASGRLWRSEEEFRNARVQRRDQNRRPEQRDRGPRPEWRDRPRGPRPDNQAAAPKPKDRWRDRPAGTEGERRERRGRDWRPGGQHKDPRDRFKLPRDVKRARFKAKLRRPPFKKPFKKKNDDE